MIAQPNRMQHVENELVERPDTRHQNPDEIQESRSKIQDKSASRRALAPTLAERRYKPRQSPTNGPRDRFAFPKISSARSSAISAPPRFVSAEPHTARPRRPVSGEGAGDNTRGRVCSPPNPCLLMRLPQFSSARSSALSAPPRFVSAEPNTATPRRPVSGEGAGDNTRGRVCSPPNPCLLMRLPQFSSARSSALSAPPRFVSAEPHTARPRRPVSGEGAGDNTPGRVCSPSPLKT